jgi:two-component system CheB/CheR fusion protein
MNLLIYFNAELQDKLIQKFNFALREGGILFLSPAETIGDHTNLFTVFNRKFKMNQAVKSLASNKITYTLPHQ